MSVELPESLSGFLDNVPDTEKTLLVVNQRSPDPLWRLLERAFDDQSVTLASRQVPEGSEDLVLLVDDGEVVATSPMKTLRDSFLLVNADRYRTGVHNLAESAIPDVLTNLSDVEFSLRGFPESNKEKLLLVVISRFIESRALSVGGGRFNVSFQQLSRLNDEYGTRMVYESLTATDLDVHVYGVRDCDQLFADALPATVHDGDSPEYRRTWFVVFRPPAGTSGHIALVAVETSPNEWRATWTTDPDSVDRVGAYVDRQL